LSLAIGRRGQNVRLASKLSGWDIEIMTQEELAESIDRAVTGFSQLEGMSVELAERLVEEGFLSYDDLSVIEPDALMAMGELSEEEVDTIVAQAEEKAMEAEAAAQEARRKKREEERLAAIEAEYAAAEAASGGAGRMSTAPVVEGAAGVEGLSDVAEATDETEQSMAETAEAVDDASPNGSDESTQRAAADKGGSAS
jgi:N utilization substance protein A